MLENVYEGLNARSKVYLSKVHFCEMYPTCVSSKLCEFIVTWTISPNLVDLRPKLEVHYSSLNSRMGCCFNTVTILLYDLTF